MKQARNHIIFMKHAKACRHLVFSRVLKRVVQNIVYKLTFMKQAKACRRVAFCRVLQRVVLDMKHKHIQEHTCWGQGIITMGAELRM